MADLPLINLNMDPIDETVRRRLQMILGPMKVAPIAADTVYSSADHLCAMLPIVDGVGEVAVTIPANTPAGHSFAVAAGLGSWPRFVAGGAGALRHHDGHARGLEMGVVSVIILSNGDGNTPVVQIAGATQP